MLSNDIYIKHFATRLTKTHLVYRVVTYLRNFFLKETGAGTLHLTRSHDDRWGTIALAADFVFRFS